ncbi:hypothetical protein Mterra_02572 [Calidithermus terrae]|uniref:Uncharacterized protein n=1 Tax=Calidithermus terrae TaxID=1408545 RepID=A0A399EE96_9DEIN|nr:hypothetical protein [Calidithermus terrae]RIH82655.1 hypothetical protein Mterra_02572 [Calidithermus terrae]
MIFPLNKAPAAGEVADLQKLQAAGLPVVATVVLQGLEAEFYQLANLAEQIRSAFAGVFGARLDEERLEAACAQAERLVRESYLLPERAEEVRRVLPGGPLLVRYAGEAPFALEPSSQEALWALKRLWASRWQVDSVLERAPTLAPPEVASLIQAAGGDLLPDEALAQRASAVLGRGVQVWASSGQVARLA